MHNTELTDEQKIKVEEILSSIITNKERSYEPDIRRTSVILYELNRMGFTIIDEILNESKEKYLHTIKQQLKNMSNSYSI
jgi:hypothetical protein